MIFLSRTYQYGVPIYSGHRHSSHLWQRLRGVQFQDLLQIYNFAQRTFLKKGHVSNKGGSFINLCFQQYQNETKKNLLYMKLALTICKIHVILAVLQRREKKEYI